MTLTGLVSIGAAVFCIAVTVFSCTVALTPAVVDIDDAGQISGTYWVDGDRFTVEYDQRNVYNESFRGFSFQTTAYRYITLDDPIILRLHAELEQRMVGFSDYEVADYLRAFVQQNIEYRTDVEMFGMGDFTQYPSETLISGRGDCEDSSALLYTLLTLSGLDAVLVGCSDHIYVGVAVDGSGEYVTLPFSDKRYYTIEATSTWRIGQEGHDESWHLVFHPYGVLIREFAMLFALLGLVSMWNYRNVVKTMRVPVKIAAEGTE